MVVHRDGGCRCGASSGLLGRAQSQCTQYAPGVRQCQQREYHLPPPIATTARLAHITWLLPAASRRSTECASVDVRCPRLCRAHADGHRRVARFVHRVASPLTTCGRPEPLMGSGRPQVDSGTHRPGRTQPPDGGGWARPRSWRWPGSHAHVRQHLTTAQRRTTRGRRGRGDPYEWPRGRGQSCSSRSRPSGGSALFRWRLRRVRSRFVFASAVSSLEGGDVVELRLQQLFGAFDRHA